MKRLSFLFFCAAFMPTSPAFAWYAGLSLGESFADSDVSMTTEEVIGRGFANAIWSEDVDVDHRQNFSFAAFIGKEIKSTPHGNFSLEFDCKYSGETSESTSISQLADSKVTVQRPLVFGMNAGFSRPITSDTSVFVRLGIAGSTFDTRISDDRTGQLYASSDSRFKWGLVPSLGIQKTISGFTLGLVYSYYIYQELMIKGYNANDSIVFSNSISPRYHLIEARISKKL